MTKVELRAALEKGSTLCDLFEVVSGEECEIVKHDRFEASDDIIYIPDLRLNDIPITRPMTQKEIQETLYSCYTGNDFLYMCGSSVPSAKALFDACTWQHPSSLLEGIDDEDDEAEEE